MIRFSANLGFLWPDRPLLDRIAAAGRAGFRAIELHWPYDIPAGRLAAASRDAGVRLLGVNTVPGDLAAGDFGLAALPGREAEFDAAMRQAVDYCGAAGGVSVHAMAGVAPRTEETRRVFTENITRAADRAEALGLDVLIEPINRFDKPGYFLGTVEQAADIIDAIGRRNVKLMFDVYHVEREQGQVLDRLRMCLPIVGHIQVAAVPGRAEPDAGELDYADVFAAIEALGYDGWIGAEYRPRGDTDEGLGWFEGYRRRPDDAA